MDIRACASAKGFVVGITILRTLAIAILVLGAASVALAVPGGFEKSPGGAQVLVWWRAAEAPSDPSFALLHGLDGSTIGLLPEGSPLLAAAAAQPLGPYDGDAPYFLISRGAHAVLQEGELPGAWDAAWQNRRRSAGGAPDVWPDELRAIAPLAQDDAQVLIRLPESLFWVAEEPGCRAQRLRPAASTEARAGKNPLLSPEPSRQPAAYWQALADAVNGERIFADLDYLSTTLLTRHSYTTQMSLACQYVLEEFQALGLTASYDQFYYQGHSLKNVVGVKTGTIDPTGIYIICGHLDSTSPSPSTLAPGAEDNGSGSAAVLEAARLLAPLQTAYTIYFICFSAEEQGLVGSEHFAEDADQRGLDIRGVLNLDMAGYYRSGGSDLWLEGFHYGTSSVWLLNQVEANAEAYTDLVVYQYPGEGWGSDHEPFHDHGFPAILSIDYEWDSYPCYHRTCDTVSYLDEHLWRGIIAANAITLGQLAALQGTTGGLSGTVAVLGGGSPDGAVARLAGTAYAEKASDLEGHFGWGTLFPGTYTLITEKTGYETDTTHVTLASGNTTSVTVTLVPTGFTAVDEETDPGVPGVSLAAGVSLSVVPSPMTSGASILLRLPSPRAGSLSICTADGRKLADLHAGGVLSGSRTFAWDGRDDRGRPAPAGIYWVRWQGEEGARASRALVVVR